jgi:hypothetical protein
MPLYCFIHNIDEKEKDTFEKIGNSSKRKDVIEQEFGTIKNLLSSLR